MHAHRLREATLRGAAGAALFLTAAVALAPPLRFAYEAPRAHVAVETAAVLIGLFAATMTWGRFVYSRRLRDLALALGLGTLVLSNLCFSALPAAAGFSLDGPFSTWAALFGRLAGAAIFASSVVLPDRRVGSRRRAGIFGLGLTLSLVAGIAAAVVAANDHLPSGLSPPPQSSIGAQLDVPIISVLQLAGLTLYSLAAVGLARRARRFDDAFVSWLALGALLAAAACLNYFLYPSLYSKWIYTGDAFRLAAYLVFLGGALVEVRRYWYELTRAAVLDERRRIARDLHDSVAQELAFIGRKAARLPVAAEREAGEIAAAAKRALAESRRTIEALSRPLDRPFADVLSEAVESAAERGPVPVSLRVDPTLILDPEAAETLLLIASEAVTNASRYSGGTAVTVDAGNDPKPRLTVADDGRGFDPTLARGGFGLRIMQERAEALGADFELVTEPGKGTRVEVAFP